MTTLPVEQFFAPVVTEQNWFGPGEKETARRFRDLLGTLRQHLSGLQAFRVEGHGGDQSVVDAYVVGRTVGGDLAGVATQLVET